MKKWQIIVSALIVLLMLFLINQDDCKSCNGKALVIVDECFPVIAALATYNRLSCFCDTHNDWQNLVRSIRSLSYRTSAGDERYPTNIFGTKVLPCYDDALQFEVYNNREIVLFIEQDTSKAVYDGALKEFYTSATLYENRKIGFLDIGSENRSIIRNRGRITIQYHVDYEELNSQVLVTFQQAMHFDSTYQKQALIVEYQMFKKKANKHEASVRYENNGSRFYLDIF